MKIELELDYKTILRNSAQPVHLVAKLTAPAQLLTQRARPAAFTVVLDRSGSMDGAPLENAKKACCEVIKNLRPDDYFSLVVFDDSAQVVIPLEKPINRNAWYQTIDQITVGASTNLMAGWLLGRDELMKAQKTAGGIAPIRKILLLTDGYLNTGHYRAGKSRSADTRGSPEGRDPDQLPRVWRRLQREYSRRHE